jgi:phage repressor protein C with HTH and peptisase S24 domain
MNSTVDLMYEAMHAAGIESQSALSRASGVPQPTINRILKDIGKKGPESQTLLALAQACNVNFQWLHEGTGPMKGHAVVDVTEVFPGARPVVSNASDSASRVSIRKVRDIRLSAGISGYGFELDQRDQGNWDVPKRWIEKNGFAPAQLFAIDVKGESMSPNLYEGDVVIVNMADKKLVSGHVYAVNYEGEAVIKRLIRDGGQWYLCSDNQSPRYPRLLCRSGECIVIGKVVHRETDHV